MPAKRAECPNKIIARILGVSRSGFYSWLAAAGKRPCVANCATARAALEQLGVHSSPFIGRWETAMPA